MVQAMDVQGEFTAGLVEAVEGYLSDANCSLRRDGDGSQANDVANIGLATVNGSRCIASCRPEAAAEGASVLVVDPANIRMRRHVGAGLEGRKTVASADRGKQSVGVGGRARSAG